MSDKIRIAELEQKIALLQSELLERDKEAGEKPASDHLRYDRTSGEPSPSLLQDAKVRGKCDFQLEESLPKSWTDLVNHHGQVVWRFENTLSCRILGWDRAVGLANLIARDKRRTNITSFFPTVAAVVLTLGIFKLVPRSAFIVAVVFYALWQITIISVLVDLVLALKICGNFNSAGTLFFVIVGQVSFGEMAGWDYRGVGWLVSMLTLTMMELLGDANPSRIRQSAFVMLNSVGIVRLTVMLILVNLQLVPDFDLAKIAFSIQLSETLVVDFSALGLFNQANIAVTVLIAKLTASFFRFSKRLPNATITLEGADADETKLIAAFSA
jgi:hypothetical protein